MKPLHFLVAIATILICANVVIATVIIDGLRDLDDIPFATSPPQCASQILTENRSASNRVAVLCVS